MTRILPLIPLLLWLTWSPQDGATAASSLDGPSVSQWLSLVWMVGGLLIIVTVMMLWARLLLIEHRHSFAPVPVRGFGQGMFVARIAGVAWYGVALYVFGYGDLVHTLMRPVEAFNIRSPGIIAAIAPTLITWFGLAWAAYPVDRTAREQNLLVEIDAGLTPRAPPTLLQSISSNFRLQVLFMLAPVLAVAALQDLISVGFRAFEIPLGGRAEGIAFLAAVLFVFIASPELLVSVLRARPLADSPLRRRLEELAARLDLRYRNILVWHTSYGIGNAAVMGLVPRFRYILLTDLLIETLDDEQIEAVFAHEAGHVKHRHLLWYVAFWAMCLLSLEYLGNVISRQLGQFPGLSALPLNVLITVTAIAIYLAMFGMLSRLFERQADVFAARSIESGHQPSHETADGISEGAIALPRRAPLATAVGPAGAESFVSALARVAEISHRPIARTPRYRDGLFARVLDAIFNFTHPSIPDRIDHLRELAAMPSLTRRFDRKVVRVMLAMLFLLMTLSTWAVVQQVR